MSATRIFGNPFVLFGNRPRLDGPDSRLRAEAAFGLGRSIEISDAVDAYGLVNVVAHSGEGNLGVEPNLGMKFKAGPVVTGIDATVRYDVFDARWHPRFKLTNMLPMSDTLGVSVGDIGRGYALSIGLNTYF